MSLDKGLNEAFGSCGMDKRPQEHLDGHWIIELQEEAFRKMNSGMMQE